MGVGVGGSEISGWVEDSTGNEARDIEKDME